MKKIFTLIFSLGLLTAAFAQDGGHRRRWQDQTYGYQDHQRYGNDQNYQTSPYSNQENWNNGRRDDDRFDNWDNYGDGNGMSDRGFGDDRGRMERYMHRQFERHSRRHGRGFFFQFGGY